MSHRLRPPAVSDLSHRSAPPMPPLFGLGPVTGPFGVVVSRLSIDDGKGAQRQGEASTKKYYHQYPVLERLRNRKDGLFDNTPRAIAQRRGWGMVEIHGSDVAGELAKDPHELVAYASWIAPEQEGPDVPVLMLDIVSSGIADNIWDPHDVDGAGKNLFSELVRMVVVAYDQGITDLMFSRWDRASRSRHWGLLEESLKRRAHRLGTWVDGTKLAWDSASAMLINSIGAGSGQAASLTFKTSCFGGLCSALNADRWPHPLFSAPLGLHRPGSGKPASRPVVWDSHQAGAIGYLLFRWAGGESIATIAAEAAMLQLPLERKDKPFHLRSETDQQTCLRLRLRDSQALTLYRTGRMSHRIVSSEAGISEIEGWQLSFATAPDTEWHHPFGRARPKDLYYYGYRDFVLEWGKPGPLALGEDGEITAFSVGTIPAGRADPEDDVDGDPAAVLGFGWTASFWNKIERRCAELTDSQIARPRAAKATTRLLTDRTWKADGYDWRMSAHQVSTLAAQRRPENTQDVWEHVVTCPDLILIEQYAELQRDFLLGLEAQTIPLDVDRATSNANARLARLRAKKKVAQQGADDLRTKATGLRATAGAVATWGLPPDIAATQIAAYGRDAAGADAEARAVTEGLSTLDDKITDAELQASAQSADVTESATLTGVLLAGVAAGQTRYDTVVHDAINDVTRQFSLQPHPDDPTRAVLTVQFALPLSNGDTATGCATREFDNERRWGTVHATYEAVEALGFSLARRRLKDSVPLADLLDDPKRTGLPTTPCRNLTHLRGYLQRHGIRARGARSAAADCPVPETTLAIWSAITDDPEVAQHLDPAFLKHIRATYLPGSQHPNAWVGREVRLARRLLAALLTAPNPKRGAGIEDLQRVTGLTRTQIGAFVRAGLATRHPWNSEVILALECPHCDGLASHYLPVPETLADGMPGLLCPNCLRLPDPARTVVFPAGYRRYWQNAPNPALHHLATGPGTVIAHKADYQPSSRLTHTDRPFNVREAAEYLGISPPAVRSWHNEGFLEARRITGVGKRVFQQVDLDLPAVQERAHEWNALFGTPAPQQDMLSLRDAATRLNVTEKSVRQAVGKGLLLVALDAGPGSAGGKFFDPALVLALPLEWRQAHARGLLSISDVQDQTGVKQREIRAAANSGQLACFSYQRSWRRFRQEAVDQWMATRNHLIADQRKAM